MSRFRMVSEYGTLRQRVEETAGIKVKTPKDFDSLAEKIRIRTGVLLSPTTLKRFWNYLDESVTPRLSTLDVLSRFCGWSNYSSFERGDQPEIESGNVGGEVIRCGVDINPGDRVRLFWAPSRVCDIEFIGGTDWKVVSSEGTRLQPGDRFSCPVIVAGEPLYLDNLIHEGSRPGVYVCGRKTGVRFLLHPIGQKKK